LAEEAVALDAGAALHRTAPPIQQLGVVLVVLHGHISLTACLSEIALTLLIGIISGYCKQPTQYMWIFAISKK
jgi:hypothetical protein